MKKIMKYSWALLLLVLAVWACTPKTAEKTVETVEETKPAPVVDASLSPCPKFNDTDNPDQASTDYVICKDYIKAKKYEEAFPLWEKVYANSPAADGRRYTVYTWGLTLYAWKYENATTDADKKDIVQKVMKVYDDMMACYPDTKSFGYGRKGFDMFYTYPTEATDKEKYDLFKQDLDINGVKAQPYVLNPFTDLLIKRFNAKEIDLAEAQKYAKLVNDVLANGLATAKGQTLESYRIVESYAPLRLEEFEATRGFYSCEYYKIKYYSKFEEAKTDCEVIEDVYSTLRWGNCPEVDEKIRELDAALATHCKEDPVEGPVTGPTPSGPSCRDLLRSGQYQEAIDCMEGAMGRSNDNEKKAKYAYAIASIYYGKFKKYSKAREYANKALEYKPGYGKAYLMIGDMYASSGPLCGPGRGWDSQVVIFVAMDMWSKAKRDPETASKAQRQINKYNQYLPDKEAAFMRGVKAGDSYKINCWIQRNTTVKLK